MLKITFMGAGSTVFAKNVLGDCLLTEGLHDAEYALYDIDPARLEDSRLMLENLNANINGNRARIAPYLGVENRRDALRGASYVVNAIQVGGYEPCTVIDFEVPKKYGLRQTIADTLGIGGIFRALRTIPVVLDFCRDMEAVCPEALFLNYVNPMAMVTAAILRATPIKTVGLCHSVQGCATGLLQELGFEIPAGLRWEIAGINHQAWLLSIQDGGRDLYPAIRERAADALARLRAKGGRRAAAEIAAAAKAAGRDPWDEPLYRAAHDMVRLEMMLRFGHYVTESSEHSAEYSPWFIKATHPGLIEEYNIPLDEYPRRCVSQIEGWARQRQTLVTNAALEHEKSHEYAASIINAMLTGEPYRVHGNVMNTGLITNLPAKACVEVACLVDRNGVQPTFVGDLPEQCAAVNRTNINVQILAVEAALTRRKDYIYQAAMLDPHTAAELSPDQIRALCDDLIAAHGEWMPVFE
ncbi:MAG: alpha-glucosidase/alpha-galactosidase [Patescibacteria group bacterium]